VIVLFSDKSQEKMRHPGREREREREAIINPENGLVLFSSLLVAS